ncbi:MAG TPA: DUF4282 domain-containing protein [Pyrinomonadaceae bacterium]
MSGYFSFQKYITSSFVKAVYFLGFLALTAGGIGLAGWAAMRLYEASIPRELGWYYVASGVGILLVGNLVWRVFCEIWIVLFNIYARLVSLDQKTGAEAFSADVRTDVSEDVEVEEMRPHSESDLLGRPGGVLGLSS